MFTLNNILKFIELQGKNISARKLEQACGLGNGTLNAAKKANRDLSVENISKIVEVYGDEIKAAGFKIIDLSPIGMHNIIIAHPSQIQTIQASLGMNPAMIEERNSLIDIEEVKNLALQQNQVQILTGIEKIKTNLVQLKLDNQGRASAIQDEIKSWALEILKALKQPLPSVPSKSRGRTSEKLPKKSLKRGNHNDVHR